MRSCLLLGASGLIGGQLLRLLLEDPAYQKVTVLGRSPLPQRHDKLQVAVGDLTREASYAGLVAVDDVFCCLGTTMKKAGSEAAFRAVDLDAPLLCARLAAAAGARQLLVVTAVGADAHSRVFYNRVKGELEDALRGLAGASFPGGVKVLRPSMLLGDRGESRPLERAGGAVMRAVAPLFVGGLQRYRAISAATVARALLRAARQEAPGLQTYEGEPLFKLGEG